MKRNLVLAITILMACMAINAQTTTIYADDFPGPQFPGGDVSLMQYVATHLQYPPMAKDKGIEGKVIVQCLIKKDGFVGEVKVMRSLSPDCDSEAMRVISSLPKFKISRPKDSIDTWMIIPVVFKLPNKNAVSEVLEGQIGQVGVSQLADSIVFIKLDEMPRFLVAMVR